jgi:hypothetical protein
MQTTRTLEVALRATSSQFVSETNRAEEALAKLHKELADTQAAAKAASALAALKREMRMSEEGQKAEATLRALSGSSREATDIFGRLGGGIRGVASELAVLEPRKAIA